MQYTKMAIIRDDIGYTVRACTAIALEAGDTEAQPALFVAHDGVGGERVELIGFGLPFPRDAEDLESAFQCWESWTTDYETLATAHFEEEGGPDNV